MVLIMLKKIFVFSFSVFVLFGTATQFQRLKYLLKQGKGQISLIHKAKDIEKMLSNNNLSDSLKAQLELIRAVKKFAEDSLFLAQTKNYTTFYDAGKNNEINWLVLAAYPYELKPYTWKFPLVGNFPYLGFFNPEDAQKEAEKLKKMGMDVRISHPVAWSTLKVFKDPVLSTMLRYSAGRIAEIIIHETTHATFFVHNNMELNENLANFIGKEGALHFLESCYGRQSAPYLAFKAELERKEFVSVFLFKSAMQLDSLYKQLAEKPDSIKRAEKNSLLRQIEKSYLELPISEKQKQETIKDSLLYNNSLYTQFLVYNQSYSALKQLLLGKYHNSIQLFITDLHQQKHLNQILDSL
jgi:predicted aminopeptidase